MNSLKNIKILIVDDESDVRNLLAEQFAEKGATVFEAKSGSEAIEILRKQAIDVVISDIKMNNLDGVELNKLIKKEIDPAPLVYFCSAFVDNSTDAAFLLGVEEIFGKPVELNTMVEKITLDLNRLRPKLLGMQDLR